MKKKRKTYNRNSPNKLYPIADESNLEKDEWEKYNSNNTTIEPPKDENGEYHYINEIKRIEEESERDEEQPEWDKKFGEYMQEADKSLIDDWDELDAETFEVGFNLPYNPKNNKRKKKYIFSSPPEIPLDPTIKQIKSLIIDWLSEIRGFDEIAILEDRLPDFEDELSKLESKYLQINHLYNECKKDRYCIKITKKETLEIYHQIVGRLYYQ